MHDRAAGEMPAGADQNNVVGNPMAFSRPRHDGGMRPRDPLAIVAVQINRHAAERLAPVGDRAVVMRMRDRDRLQSAERPDVVDRLARDEGNAIPHYDALRLRHQQRALPDRKTRLNADRGNPDTVRRERTMMCPQILAYEPPLPV